MKTLVTEGQLSFDNMEVSPIKVGGSDTCG